MGLCLLRNQLSCQPGIDLKCSNRLSKVGSFAGDILFDGPFQPLWVYDPTVKGKGHNML
jgi:hypothetical protein